MISSFSVLKLYRTQLRWQRLHTDFAGPFLNRIFLMAVDAHLWRLEVERMTLTILAKAIETLQRLFARYGVAAQLVRRVWAVPQKKRAQKHLVRALSFCQQRFRRICVESLKNGRKTEKDVKSLNSKLTRFLVAYRKAPYSATGEPLSQLFLGRRLRTRLDLFNQISIFR